ncbi:cysteine hydrolase family protein [Pseudonocardia acaciae]|uniref:cysteine hydrolase family protein n=1 Tax=Pseudonocardia acaciae TaxID=551276 RepID=UPI0005698CAD|nr:isochorismatase family cysteine hydrolase [Pseudonocardia acaciae]
MDPVSDFLRQYGRTEDDLLDARTLNAPGVFAGEREFIEFAERDYGTDKHWAFEIRPEECALIVVDMQEDFVNPAHPMCVPEAYRQVPRIQHVIEECRLANVPVIYTEHTIAPDVAHDFYQYWPPIKAGAIAEGKPGSRVYHGFSPREGERIISAKHTYDSFAGTDLDYALRNRGVKTLIISGTLTNFCCESTARTGYFLGYHIVFGSDINATDSALAHEATLRTMRRGFARVLDHGQIVDTLRGTDALHQAATRAAR